VSRGQRDGSLRPYSRLSRSEKRQAKLKTVLSDPEILPQQWPRLGSDCRRIKLGDIAGSPATIRTSTARCRFASSKGQYLYALP
jgi:hypothetical protein